MKRLWDYETGELEDWKTGRLEEKETVGLKI
jgi:hypothetical protein